MGDVRGAMRDKVFTPCLTIFSRVISTDVSREVQKNNVKLKNLKNKHRCFKWKLLGDQHFTS